MAEIGGRSEKGGSGELLYLGETLRQVGELFKLDEPDKNKICFSMKTKQTSTGSIFKLLWHDHDQLQLARSFALVL